MVAQQVKKCTICGSEFVSRDRRKMYCGGSCKQESHRQRHGLSKPAFLQLDAPKTQKTRPKPQPRPNPAYQAKADVIGQLEQHIQTLRLRKEANKGEEARIFSQDVALRSRMSTAILSAGVFIGVAVVGFVASQTSRDKDEAKNTKLIAMLIGLSLAVFLAIATYGDTKNKNQSRKIERIKRLKEQSERLDVEIASSEAELTVHRMELCGLSATISDYVEENSPEEIIIKPSGSVVTATELQKMEFDLLTTEAKYMSLFGQLERGFAMAVYGQPGQGKSTFAIDLAYELAVANGNGIYISAEEGFGQSLQRKSNRFTTDHLLLSNHRTLASVRAELKRTHYDVVVLDSIQQISISPDELISLREAFPRTSFIYILQARKDGTFKGDNRYAHDADIQLKMEGWVPYVEKTRYHQVA